MFFTLLISFIILQRLVELYIAKKNEAWMKARGAYEVGREHYKYIVSLHVMFLFSLVAEVYIGEKEMAEWGWLPLLVFILAQCLRFWSIKSLGRRWNTRIIVLPKDVVRTGPYRFLKHPNYVTVAIEILVIPLIFQAYWTAVIFSVLNAVVLLGIRIPVEERALNDTLK